MLAGQLGRQIIDALLRNELVIVDELGFAPLHHTETQLTFGFATPQRPEYQSRPYGVLSRVI